MSKRRVSGIIPNMTMRGVDISDREIDLTSEYCDTVEISYYSNLFFGEEVNEQTVDTISKRILLLQTDIHYVILEDSIDGNHRFKWVLTGIYQKLF